MKLALLCAAALAAAPAFSQDLVARNGSDTVRLTDEPCSSELVLGQLQPQLHPALKAALVQVEGQTFSACWGAAGNAVYLLYEDGDEGVIPVNELKAELSA